MLMNSIYKKMLIILASIFLYMLDASADAIKPEQKESSTHIQNEILNKKDRYISFDVGITTSRADLPHLMRFKYGRYLSEQTFFEIGISLRPYTQEPLSYFLSINNEKFCIVKEEFDQFLLFIDITYGFDFIKDGRWIPGIDASVFIKPFYLYEKDDTDFTMFTVSGGIEVGLYLKAFISESYSIFLRPGFSFDSEEMTELSYTGLGFLNLGFQGYF